MRSYLPDWPAGRWIAHLSLAVGAFFGVYQTATGDPVYVGFLKGIGAAAAAMVLGGLAERLHAGDRMQGAQLPGGAGAQFETNEAATKTRESVEQLNTRVTHQSEQMITTQAQLDRRVSDLEDAVFKDHSHRPSDEPDQVKFRPPKDPGKGGLESQ